MVDILVLGATGYTGKLITRYLAGHRDRDTFKLGIAARSKSKLDKLVADFSLEDVQTYTVDVTDGASLDALLHESQAKVLLTTVGPYRKYGYPVARACARNGVHYVDISGEAPFVRQLIEEIDILATKTKTILIPSCGFDSAPSDAIAYLSAITLRSSLKSTDPHAFENVKVAVSHTMMKAKMGISGGTVASVLNMLETMPRKVLARAQLPDALTPIKLLEPQPLEYVSTMPAVHPKRYGHFSLLVPHNVAIVQRTRGLFHAHAKVFEEDEENGVYVRPVYAENFKYSESWASANRFTAYLVSLGISIGSACLFLFPPVRWLVKRMVPSPGEGPSDKALEKGFLECDNISVSTPHPDTKRPIVVESQLRGRGDPAYALTAVTASEIALALLVPREELTPLARQGGVLTPATALGPILIKRLSASGRFELESRVREVENS